MKKQLPGKCLFVSQINYMDVGIHVGKDFLHTRLTVQIHVWIGLLKVKVSCTFADYRGNRKETVDFDVLDINFIAELN